MDFIIVFFRDILDGPLYIVIAVVCIILICSCIGYLAEKSLNKRKKQQEYESSHARVSSDSNVDNSISMESNSETRNVPVMEYNQQSVSNNEIMNSQFTSNNNVMPNYSQQPSILPSGMVVPPTSGTNIQPPSVTNTIQNINKQ